MKAALLLGMSLLGSCAVPAAGTRCDAGVAYCASSGSALSCQAGVLQPFTCTGPKGCSLGAGRAVLCDQSTGAIAGTPCFPEHNRHGQCTSDAGSRMECVSERWVQVACPSGTKCQDGDFGVVCK